MKRSGAVLAALLVLVAGTLGWFIGRHGASTTSTTSTSISSTSTTTTSPVQASTAVWPFASASERFTSAVVAARSFAVQYMGFSSPIVGAFQAGDTRSGEVPVRASASGVVTTVLVRQLDATDTWWVLGASSPSITVTSPAALSLVTSPMMMTGESTAFEAVVNVELRTDGTLASLFTTTVMGGSMGVMGAFKKSMGFVTPTVSGGALMFRTYSAKDGHVLEATVVRVKFAR